MKRFILIAAAVVGLSFAACDSKKDAPPAEGGVETVVVEVTADEKAAFEKAAAAEITEANAEAEAAKLLEEIEADLE